MVLLVVAGDPPGLSCMEAITAIAAAGGDFGAAAAVVDRSAGEADMGVPFFPLVELNFPTYAPDEVPEELAALPVEKPGSRKA
jgi:orotate phosphoribosyltransferase